MTDKPTITWEEFGRDGNTFAVAGAVSRAYERAGRKDDFAPISKQVFASSSYEEALRILADAVEFVEPNDDEWDEDDDDES